MSLTRPTLFELAAAFTGVAGSPACMSFVGVSGWVAESLANWIRPLVEHGRAFDVIGRKPSRGVSRGDAWAALVAVSATSATDPNAPSRRRRVLLFIGLL